MVGKDDTQYQLMASKVVLLNGENPGRNSVRTFFQRVDRTGADWYPGYTAHARGRPLSMRPQKRKAIAASMMAAKKRGIAPSYEVALALAPSATLNQDTDAPFSRQTINAVLTTDCYATQADHGSFALVPSGVRSRIRTGRSGWIGPSGCWRRTTLHRGIETTSCGSTFAPRSSLDPRRRLSIRTWQPRTRRSGS